MQLELRGNVGQSPVLDEVSVLPEIEVRIEPVGQEEEKHAAQREHVRRFILFHTTDKSFRGVIAVAARVLDAAFKGTGLVRHVGAREKTSLIEVVDLE